VVNPVQTPPSDPVGSPSDLTAEDREAYAAATSGCVVVDISERGKLALTGAEAKDFLHGQVTNDILALEPGRGCYAAFLTHKGKMLGDLRVSDFGAELLLDCERVALQPLFTLIHRYRLGRDVQLHKRTLERGMLALIGPDARRIAAADRLGPREHDNVAAAVDGVPVHLIATAFGLDVVGEAQDIARVRAALERRGAQPAPERVAETVRIEAGRPRYGVDLDDTVIPQEAALNERAVSFTKGCYVGQETVARLFYRGKPNRHLRGLRLSAAALTGTPLILDGKEVGRIGSTAVSPAHGPIALALVRREVQPGDTVAVGDGDVTATVAELPF
jgi:folate-binding protein YgfZ